MIHSVLLEALARIEAKAIKHIIHLHAGSGLHTDERIHRFRRDLIYQMHKRPRRQADKQTMPMPQHTPTITQTLAAHASGQQAQLSCGNAMQARCYSWAHAAVAKRRGEITPAAWPASAQSIRRAKGQRMRKAKPQPDKRARVQVPQAAAKAPLPQPGLATSCPQLPCGLRSVTR